MKSGAIATLCAGLYAGSTASVFAQEQKDPKSYFTIPHESKTERSYYFTKNTFTPHLKSIFQVQLGFKVTNLQLVRIKDCAPQWRLQSSSSKQSTADNDSQCFALIFRADNRLSEFQTIFPMDHAALGRFSLFLVETEDDAGRFYYTATINHLTP
jgi:hypothetical protein